MEAPITLGWEFILLIIRDNRSYDLECSPNSSYLVKTCLAKRLDITSLQQLLQNMLTLKSPVPPTLYVMSCSIFQRKLKPMISLFFTSTFLVHLALLWSQMTLSSSFSPAYSATLPLLQNQSASSLPSPACPYMPWPLVFFSTHVHSRSLPTSLHRNGLFHSFP